MNSSTQTQRRTIADVRKVLNNFGADYGMIAQSTGLDSRAEVESTVEDLILFANANYLISVAIILWDSTGKKIKGRRYTVSNSATGWPSDEPGDNLWPKTLGGTLQLIATLSAEWFGLDQPGRESVKQKLGIKGKWPTSTSETSFTGMTAIRDRQYASNSFGVARETFS